MFGRSRSDPSTAGDSAWRAIIRGRWVRLQQLIALHERRLGAIQPESDRARVQNSLRTLKRAALSVWLDAQAEGLELSRDQLQTGPRDSRRNDAAS